MNFAETVAHHRLQPDVSLEAYRRQLKIALGESLASKTAVYLDTKYWILLRDSANGKNSDASIREILIRLREGVGCGRLFCPISSDTFMELLKQSEADSRAQTVALVDSLSCGISLASAEARILSELLYFLREASPVKTALYPLQSLVWTKLAAVLGDMPVPAPSVFETGSAEELALQKSYLDRAWALTFEEMMSILDGVDGPPNVSQVAAYRINNGNSAHRGDFTSYRSLYKQELYGILDLYVEETALMCRNIWGQTPNAPDGILSQDWRPFARDVLRILTEAMSNGAETRTVRTLHILATLYSGVRWNAGQQLQANDFHDFGHASAALAYCDVFFTEKRLFAAIKRKHASLDTLYGCRLAWKPSEALEHLISIEPD